jgi:hypothetical protein
LDDAELREQELHDRREQRRKLDLAAVERDRADAERYRFLVNNAWGVPQKDGSYELTFRSFGVQWRGRTTKEVADEAIDASRHKCTPVWGSCSLPKGHTGMHRA